MVAVLMEARMVSSETPWTGPQLVFMLTCRVVLEYAGVNNSRKASFFVWRLTLLNSLSAGGGMAGAP